MTSSDLTKLISEIRADLARHRAIFLFPILDENFKLRTERSALDRFGGKRFDFNAAQAIRHAQQAEKKQSMKDRLLTYLIELFEEGISMSLRELAKVFAVGKSTIARYKRQLLLEGLLPA